MKATNNLRVPTYDQRMNVIEIEKWKKRPIACNPLN